MHVLAGLAGRFDRRKHNRSAAAPAGIERSPSARPVGSCHAPDGGRGCSIPARAAVPGSAASIDCKTTPSEQCCDAKGPLPSSIVGVDLLLGMNTDSLLNNMLPEPCRTSPYSCSGTSITGAGLTFSRRETLGGGLMSVDRWTSRGGSPRLGAYIDHRGITYGRISYAAPP
eukprot:SAG11_NODE_2688_length_3095_cov_2.431575_2_plen_171_part_00